MSWVSQQYSHDEEVLVGGLQRGRYRDAAGCLDLVAGEHPELDACVSDGLDGDPHVLLQLVFHAGDAQELHVLLEILDDDAGVLFSVGRDLRFMVLLLPGQVLFVGQRLLSDHQSAQAFSREVLALIGQEAFLYFRHFLNQGDVCSFEVENESLGLSVPQHNAHSFRFGGEREVLQDLVVLFLVERVPDAHRLLVPELERHAHAFGELD